MPSASPVSSFTPLAELTDRDVLSFTEVHELHFEGQSPSWPRLTLPTRDWASLPLRERGHIIKMTIQHGAVLPRLQVRYIHNGWSRSHHKQLDKALVWLCEDLDKDRPILGLDAEGGERSIMLVQLATARRCLLLRMPSPEKVSKNERLFSDTFRALMKNRSIVKCGAELWTDVLDMWGAGRQLPTDGCANITLLHTDNRDRSDSLQTMCEKVIGVDSFRKDCQTTCSGWGVPTLTLRQLIYAALDAQTSYMLGARTSVLPVLLHLSDLPAHWLDRAYRWHLLQRLEDKELEKELEVAFTSVVFGIEGVVVTMKQYCTRIRRQSNVCFYWLDGSSNQMTVSSVEGKVATLIFTGGGDSRSALRTSADLEMIQLNRADEADLYRRPARKYLSAFMHGTESASPFLAALLQLTFPAIGHHQTAEAPSDDDDDDHCRPSWWWDSQMPTNGSDYAAHSSFASLNASQQKALRLTDEHRITIIQGPPGTGKTRTIAAEVVRSLHRGGTSQRVLCVAETNTAARHMCEAIAEHLGPEDVQLLVSREFEFEWHEELYDDLVEKGYMVRLAQWRAARSKARTPPRFDHTAVDPPVLVCTIGKCLGTGSADALMHRQTLILDEASQVHDFKAIVLLRHLPHTERLLLFGDDKQLAPYVAREEASSILDMATAVLEKNLVPPAPTFSVARTMLDIQYRMPLALGNMISSIFYNGKLRSHKADPKACVHWVPAVGPSSPDGTSCYNRSEIAEVIRLWRQLQRPPYSYGDEDIVVISFYEAQRKEISTKYPRVRVHNVDSFQGQEAPVVLLTLSASYISKFLSDRRRVNVACSRAKEKLFIIGRQDMVQRSRKRTCWQDIEQHCQLTTSPIIEATLPAAPTNALRSTLYSILCAQPQPITISLLGALYRLKEGHSFNERNRSSLGALLRAAPDMFLVSLPTVRGHQPFVSAVRSVAPTNSPSTAAPRALLPADLIPFLTSFITENGPCLSSELGDALRSHFGRTLFTRRSARSMKSFFHSHPQHFRLLEQPGSKPELVALTINPSKGTNLRPRQTQSTQSPLSSLSPNAIEEQLCTLLRSQENHRMDLVLLASAFSVLHDGRQFTDVSRSVRLLPFLMERARVFRVLEDDGGRRTRVVQLVAAVDMDIAEHMSRLTISASTRV